MRPNFAKLLISILILVIAGAAPNDKRKWTKVSPFTRVKIVGDASHVEYDGQIYDLISIDGHPTADVMAFCRRTYCGKWQERFAMDLADVLIDMGQKPDPAVTLVLRDATTSRMTTVDRAPMTEANRNAVRDALHPAAPPPARNAIQNLQAKEMRAALKDFQQQAEDRWSYLPLSKLDLDEAVKKIENRIEAGITANEFILELQKIIAQGIDGHAEVDDWETAAPVGDTPFLVEPVGDRFVAFTPDRKGFLAEGFPFIESIDDQPLAKWLDVAGRFVPKGSPQYVRQHEAGVLRFIQLLRNEMNAGSAGVLEVTLASPDSKTRKSIKLDITGKLPSYGTWPREDFKPNLPANIAYVRVAKMDEKQNLAGIFESISRNAKITGVILDVRDNRGGSRDALRDVATWLLPTGSPPRVVNAAVQRVHPRHDADDMTSRFLFPENAAIWSPAEKLAIANFRKTFRPEWDRPAKGFGDWHFAVLTASPDQKKSLNKPVIVLMNSKCFSATDIFLSALKGVSNITLLGTPSAGGSANPGGFDLAGTSIRVRLGTMVSFQSDGKLFDTHGVQPDICVESEPEFFIGGKDDQLEAAIEKMRK